MINRTGGNQFPTPIGDSWRYRARVCGLKNAPTIIRQPHAEQPPPNTGRITSGDGREEIGHVHDVHTGKRAHASIDPAMTKGQLHPAASKHVYRPAQRRFVIDIWFMIRSSAELFG